MKEHSELDVVMISADLVLNLDGPTRTMLEKAGLASAENWIFSDGFAERLRFEIDVRRTVELGGNRLDLLRDWRPGRREELEGVRFVCCSHHRRGQLGTEHRVQLVGREENIREQLRMHVAGEYAACASVADRIDVIAAGAEPFVPPIPGLKETGYLTSDTVWGIREQPKRLVVLGGGPIGSELTQAFARLGSQVTQVEMLPRILPREDVEISQMVLERFKAEGIDVRVNTKAKAVKFVDNEKRLLVEKDGVKFLTGVVLSSEGLAVSAKCPEWKVIFMSTRDHPSAWNTWSSAFWSAGTPADLDNLLILPLFEAGFLQPIAAASNDLYELDLASGAVRRLTTNGDDGWIIPEFVWDPAGERLLWTEAKYDDGGRMQLPPDPARDAAELAEMMQDPPLPEGASPVGLTPAFLLDRRTMVGTYAVD